MKKIITLVLTIIGIMSVINAQGECRIDNVPGGYIHETHTLNTDVGGGYDCAVTVNIKAYGVNENADGAVSCVVTYIDNAGKQRQTEPASISYNKRTGSKKISLPDTYPTRGKVKVISVKIENSWCSAR